MFKVSFVCDDKKLADALRGLTGISIGAPEAVPVVNAVKKNGKVEAASGGSNAELFAKYAKEHKVAKYKAPEMRAFCKSIGASPASYGYMIKQFRKVGLLKKHGTGTGSYYTVAS